MSMRRQGRQRPRYLIAAREWLLWRRGATPLPAFGAYRDFHEPAF